MLSIMTMVYVWMLLPNLLSVRCQSLNFFGCPVFSFVLSLLHYLYTKFDSPVRLQILDNTS